MFETRTSPPVMGLLFLCAVAGGVGWAATAETDPTIDRKPALVAEPQTVAGAEQSRMAELTRRTVLVRES